MRDPKEIDRLLSFLPYEWKENWCEADACACLGCVNVSGNQRLIGAYDKAITTDTPISKEEWTTWKEWRDAFVMRRRAKDKLTVDQLVRIANRANIPAITNHPGDFTFTWKGWQVVCFYDCAEGGEFDYIDHFSTPKGREIDFWDWEYGEDRDRLKNWRPAPGPGVVAMKPIDRTRPRDGKMDDRLGAAIKQIFSARELDFSETGLGDGDA